MPNIIPYQKAYHLARQTILRQFGDYLKEKYVALEATASCYDTQDRKSAHDRFQEFLNSQNQVLLVLGESGAGKSIFAKLQFLKACDAYERHPDSMPLPLWVNLPTYQTLFKDAQQRKDNPKLLETHLTENDKKLDIPTLKLRSLLVFLEGYDEAGIELNLYHINDWVDWQLQIVITCRTQALKGNYRELFYPITAEGLRDIDHYQELALQPFNAIQKVKFLELCQQEQAVFEKLSMQHPGLKQMADNPLFLSLLIKALPSLGQERQLAKVDIYEYCVESMLERERGKHHLTQFDRNRHLQWYEQKACHLFIKRELVWLVPFEIQDESEQVLYNRRSSQPPFTSNLDGLVLLRAYTNSNGIVYSFFHKSIWEYLVASRLKTEILDLGQSNSEDAAERLADSSLSYFLNQRLIQDEPALVQCLAEWVHRNEELQKALINIVEHSKYYTHLTLASANAMTTLCAARIPFSGHKLRNARFAGAHLVGGIFDSTDMRYTDSRYVNYQQAFLYKANLEGSCLTDIQLGEQPILAMFENVIQAMCYSNESQYLAASMGYKVWIQNTITGQSYYLTEPSESINCIAFSRDGLYLFTGSRGNTIKRWDVLTGNCLTTYQGHNDGITCIAIGSKHVISGSHDTTVKCWDIHTGECLNTYQGHTDFITSIAISSDDKYLLSASERTLKRWEMSTGNCLMTYPDNDNGAHFFDLSSIMFSPDGQRIVTGSWDRAIKCWDTHSGECLNTYEGHTDLINRVVFSPCGQYLASASKDNTLKLWDANSGQCINTYEGHYHWVIDVAFCFDGQQLISASVDGHIQRWNIDKALCLYSTNQRHNDVITSIAWSPDGQTFISGDRRGTLKRWDINGNCLNTFQDGNDYREILPSIISISFSTDGKHFFSIHRPPWSPESSNNNVIIYWDIFKEQRLKIYRGHKDKITCAILSSDNQYLFSGSKDQTIKRWDVLTGNCLTTYQGHTGRIVHLEILSDEKTLVSLSSDNTYKDWDIESGECRLHTYSKPSLYAQSKDQLKVNTNGQQFKFQKTKVTRKPKLLVEGSPDKKHFVSGTSYHEISLSQHNLNHNAPLYNAPLKQWTTHPKLDAVNCNLHQCMGLSTENALIFTQHYANEIPKLTIDSIANKSVACISDLLYQEQQRAIQEHTLMANYASLLDDTFIISPQLPAVITLMRHKYKCSRHVFIFAEVLQIDPPERLLIRAELRYDDPHLFSSIYNKNAQVTVKEFQIQETITDTNQKQTLLAYKDIDKSRQLLTENFTWLDAQQLNTEQWHKLLQAINHDKDKNLPYTIIGNNSLNKAYNCSDWAVDKINFVRTSKYKPTSKDPKWAIPERQLEKSKSNKKKCLMM